MRVFETGATRDADDTKIDPCGYFSPSVIRRASEYMRVHSIQADGERRSSRNWKLGIPLEAYAASMWRHFLDVWQAHEEPGTFTQEQQEEALCALIFNASGYLHELLRWKA